MMKNIRGKGKPAGVPDDIILKALSDKEIFDTDGKIKKESNIMWKDVSNNLLLKGFQVTYRNLYTKFFYNRNGIKTKWELEKKTAYPEITEIKKNVEENDVSAITKTQNAEVKIGDEFKKLKKDVFYRPIFKEIGLSPLQIIYRWPQQRIVWLKLNRSYPVVIIGFTDEFICYKSRHMIEERKINFYSIFGQNNHTLIPIYQFITEMMHVENLDYCISEWLNEKIPSPKYIFTFPSLALIQGILRSMNHTDLNNYLNDLFDFSVTKNSKLKYPCILQFDIYPIAKSMFDDICSTNDIGLEIKYFMTCSLLYISSLIQLETFNEAAENLLLIYCSEYLNEFVTEARNKLVHAIKKSKIENYLKVLDNRKYLPHNHFMTEFFLTMENSNSLQKYWTTLKESVEKKSSKKNSMKNPYFNVKISNLLLKVLKCYPMWTGIVPYKESNDKPRKLNINFLELGVNLEEYFENMKEKVMGTRDKLTPWEFCKFQGDFLKSKIAEYIDPSSPQSSSLQSVNNEDYSINYTHSFLGFQENWKNRMRSSIQEHFRTPELVIGQISHTNISTTIDDHHQNLINDNTRNNISDISSIHLADVLSSTIDNSKNNNVEEADEPVSAIEFNSITTANEISSVDSSIVITGQVVNNSSSLLTTTNGAYSKRERRRIIDSPYFPGIQNRKVIPKTLSIDSSNLSIQPTSEDAGSNKILIPSQEKVNLNKRAPSKYCDPNPRAGMKKPNVHLKNVLIKNGNLMSKMQKYNRKNYSFENTSPFDTIVEILIRAFCNELKFYEHCKKLADKGLYFFKIIKNLATTADISKYEEDRLELLKQISHIDRGNVITCRENVSSYFKKLMILPSLNGMFKCKCGEKKITEYFISNIFSIELDDLIQSRVNKILLEKEKFNNKSLCEYCADWDLAFGIHDYMCINMENKDSLIKISDIQKEIVFKNKKFNLVGVIIKDLESSHTITNYLAYCRSPNGFWSIKDNSELKSSSTTGNKKQEINLIIYVQTE